MRYLFNILLKLFLFIFVLSVKAVPKNICDSVLISNVNIVDVANNSIRPNQHLLIVGDEIKLISASKPKFTAGTKLINATGKYLMPGLIDMHVHVFQPADAHQLLRYGITTARVMYGWPQTLEYRDQIKKGDLLGPDLVVASPIINQKSEYANSFIHKFIDSPNQAQELVTEYAERGYDLIKTYDGLQPGIFSEISKTAKQFNLPIAGHPSFFLSLDEYIAEKPQTIEHIEMLFQASLNYSKDKTELKKLANKLALHQIPVTTTLVVYDNLARMALEKQAFIDNLPVEYIHPFMKKHEQDSVEFITNLKNPQEWRDKANYLGYMAKTFEENSVPLVIGSDGGVGYTINGISTIEEMELLAGYGVPINSILQAATITPAKTLNREKEIGRVKAGYKANLILLNSDPRQNLSVLRQPIAVIKLGNVLNDKDLNQLDVKAKQHMGWLKTWWNLFWAT